MIVLALDTCLGACSAAVVEDGRVLAARSQPMWRGHQERLASLVRETMAEAGVPFGALARVGATVGPGSFTGLRVGVAFAKGLSVALGIPAVGVGALEAFAAGVPGRAIAVADARRGQVYWQAFDDGRPVTEPAVGPLDSIPTLPGEGQAAKPPGWACDGATPPSPALRAVFPPLKGEGRILTLLGPGAPLLAALFPAAAVQTSDAPDPAAVARLAASAPHEPIRPLYLRPPDAKLPGGVDPFAA